MDLAQKVRELAKEGHSRMEVSRRLGVSRHALRAYEADWRPRGKTLQCRARAQGNRTQASRDNLRQQAIAGGRAKLIDVGNGRQMTIGQVAQTLGCSRHAVIYRIKAGARGAALLAPARKRQGGRPKHYVWQTGLSVKEWQVVLDYARQHNVRRAGNKFNLPVGAISALLRGEDWRVE